MYVWRLFSVSVLEFRNEGRRLHFRPINIPFKPNEKWFCWRPSQYVSIGLYMYQINTNHDLVSFRFGSVPLYGRSQWPPGLRRRCAAERLLESWVWIPPGAWMFASCECCVLSGRGLCDRPIPLPEESYRLWYVSECDQVKINNLDTYCEQVGRRGKDYETKRNRCMDGKAQKFIEFPTLSRR
jgi:hypothetical protein